MIESADLFRENAAVDDLTHRFRFVSLKLLLLFLVAASWAGHLLSAGTALEAGRPFLQNFGLRDYHAHNQNWSAAQDSRGVLYFGNKNVVLEYDGVTWRKILINETTYIRGLAFDPAANAIFLGGVDELGYLRLEPDGSRLFVSLLDRLPAEARGFRDIRRVYLSAAGEIVFVADSQVMRWRAGKFAVWKPGNTTTLSSFLVDGHVFVQSRDLGLLRMDGGGAVPVAPEAAFLKENAVTLLVPGTSPGELLAGTQEHGLWKISSGGTALPFPTGADEFLQRHKLRRGRKLAGGTLALATADAGLVWLAADGSFLGRVDETTGLQNDHILDLFTDREGGLWLTLNSGLTRVELSAGLTVFDTGNGLKRGTVRDLWRLDGKLFLATENGLYRLAPAEPGPTARPARCERLVEGEFWGLCPDGAGGLLLAGSEGVYQWHADGRSEIVLPTATQVMALRRSSRDPARVWLGTRQGLGSIRQETGGGWKDEGPVPGCKEDTRTVVETPDGAVWLGTTMFGVFRVTFRGDGASPRGSAVVANYFKTHGLPDDMHWTRVIPWHQGRDVLLATQAGFYLYDPTADRFLSVTDYGRRLGDGGFMLGNVAEDVAGDLWLAGRLPTGVWLDQELGRAEHGTGRWEALPERIADKVGEIEHILPEVGPDGDGVVWIAGTDGMVRVEVGPRESRASGHGDLPPFTTLIRRVFTANGQPRALPTGGAESLPASDNSLRFEFAADTYHYGAGVRYQTRLDGLGRKGWSDLSSETSIGYTNLPAGGYTFRVRSRAADGQAGREAAFSFRILPHWSRTASALTGYAVLGVLGVAGLLRWRLRRFVRENTRLEARVASQTGELVRARDAAETANRAKSAFLANMSHELRTPLNAVLGYAQIMLKDQTLSEKNRERLNVVARSGEHLLAMINEVLDLSKIEAGKLSPHPVDFPLARLLDAAEEAFRPRAAEKKIAFSLHRAPDLPAMVHGDEGKLRQVLFNLLSNAVKFTSSGDVEFKIDRPRPGRLRFGVRDSGIGIAAEELQSIFLAFHQAPNAGTALASQGTGLGLAISQRLVTMLGGELRVESAPGKGSRFSFELALPEVDAPVPVQLDALFAVTAHPEVTGYDGPRRRVLVVDDDVTNRRVLRELLTPLGFEVEELPSGDACLARCARAPRPDVVLLDLRMSGTDGFGTARALRQRAGNEGLKIIAVSASVFEADQQQALDAGCDDFLPKPFAEDALLSVLGRSLSLTWKTRAADVEAPRGVSDASEEEPLPLPSGEVDALLELSRRGDILKIRRRLADLRASGPRHAKCVEPLEALAAGYRMNSLRDALLELQRDER